MKLVNPMTDAELYDELITLIRGQDTTATAIAWAYIWDSSSPQVGYAVVELNHSGEILQIQHHCNKLPYLTFVAKPYAFPHCCSHQS